MADLGGAQDHDQVPSGAGPTPDRQDRDAAPDCRTGLASFGCQRLHDFVRFDVAQFRERGRQPFVPHVTSVYGLYTGAKDGLSASSTRSSSATVRPDLHGQYSRLATERGFPRPVQPSLGDSCT